MDLGEEGTINTPRFVVGALKVKEIRERTTDEGVGVTGMVVGGFIGRRHGVVVVLVVVVVVVVVRPTFDATAIDTSGHGDGTARYDTVVTVITRGFVSSRQQWAVRRLLIEL